MKYLGENQKTSDCAIVGAFNACAWLKIDFSYEDLEYIAKEFFEYDPEKGLDDKNLKDFMDFIGIKVESLLGKSPEYAKDKVLSGKGCIASIYESEESGHVVFLKPEKNRVVILNSDKTWDELMEDLQEEKIYLGVWAVSKAS